MWLGFFRWYALWASRWGRALATPWPPRPQAIAPGPNHRQAAVVTTRWSAGDGAAGNARWRPPAVADVRFETVDPGPAWQRRSRSANRTMLAATAACRCGNAPEAATAGSINILRSAPVTSIDVRRACSRACRHRANASPRYAKSRPSRAVSTCAYAACASSTAACWAASITAEHRCAISATVWASMALRRGSAATIRRKASKSNGSKLMRPASRP